LNCSDKFIAIPQILVLARSHFLWLVARFSAEGVHSERITAYSEVIERQPRILPLRVRITGLLVSARRITADPEIFPNARIVWFSVGSIVNL
jgi:hypothetical protein